jgi:hypothetical protein
MKRAMLCLAACLAFAVCAAAQTTGSTAGASPDQDSGGGKHHKMSGNSITGCVEKTDGGYAVKHGNKSIPVTGSDDLSAHVGHTVTLTGSWASAADKSAASTSGGEKTFNETGIKMVSETCTGGGKHKKGSTGSDTSTTPK